MTKSLSRKDNHRKSLLRNLATSLILYEEIKTTKTKAQAVKPIVENLILTAKKSTRKEMTKRRLLKIFFDKNATKKVLDVLVPRYQQDETGIVQVYKIGPRSGDNASMVILKLKTKETTKIKSEKEQEDKNGKVTKSRD